jgi:geranylgeranylglycerol-phosphate geranylgeranyltransferase
MLFGSFFITWIYLEPTAVYPLLIGVILNILYEFGKGKGLLGNILFGLMIAMCGLFGFMASGPLEYIFTKSRISALVFIALLNGLMTYYTYFKDFVGDKAAGKRTIVVKYGLERNRYIAIFASFLPSILFVIGYFGFRSFEIELNKTFVILGFLTIFLQIWTGWLYYKNPKGEMTYYSLVTNFRACTCGQAAIIALFNPVLGMMLWLMCYVFVGFLFNLHTNIKA